MQIYPAALVAFLLSERTDKITFFFLNSHLLAQNDVQKARPK